MPEAGMCLSVFAIVSNSENAILFGIPKNVARWQEDWLHSKRKENSEIFEQWRLPSCYLREGEHPDIALSRVMKEELGIGKFQAERNPRIVSYYSPSDWYPGRNHWDMAFIYRVAVGDDIKLAQEWWKRLEFCKPEQLKEKEFGWNSDLIHDLELA
jgi:hypothetical protein